MKEACKYVAGILVTILVVVVSIPIWENSFANKNLAIINEYISNDLNLDYDEPEVRVIDKKDYNDYAVKQMLTIKNYDSNKKIGELYFVVSSCDFNHEYINIMIDNENYSLKELSEFNNGEDIYYKLLDFSIDAYEEKEFEYSIWIDDKIPKINNNDILVANFKVK